MATDNVVHVRCTDTGTWTVHPEDRAEPVSAHTSESHAEAAARRHVGPAGRGAIVVHDRYRRTHVVPAGSHR